MKKRKFDEGGGVREGKNVNINDETRANAMAFARKADEEDREKNMQELLRSRGEGEKPRNPMRSTIEPAEPGAPAIRREVAVEPEPARSTPRAAPAPTPRAPAPAGKFTDSDAESRAARQSEAEDENVKRIQRARDEEDNESKIRQARYRTQEKEQALERVQPETALPVGKVARLAQAAAGALSRDRDSVQRATEFRNRELETRRREAVARAKAKDREEAKSDADRVMDLANKRASETRQARSDADRVMDLANKRAAHTRAERADRTEQARALVGRRQAQSRARSEEATSRMEGEGGMRAVSGRPPKRPNQPARNREESTFADEGNPNFKRGGKVSNGFSKASSRADGIAKRGKTRGRIY